MAFVREIHWWPVNSQHKWPVTRKIFPLDDVIKWRHHEIILQICHYGHIIRWLTISQNLMSGARQVYKTHQIAKFMGPTWDPPGSCRPQMGPTLAPWTLLSGTSTNRMAGTLQKVLLNVFSWTFLSFVKAFTYGIIELIMIKVVKHRTNCDMFRFMPILKILQIKGWH